MYAWEPRCIRPSKNIHNGQLQHDYTGAGGRGKQITCRSHVWREARLCFYVWSGIVMRHVHMAGSGRVYPRSFLSAFHDPRVAPICASSCGCGISFGPLGILHRSANGISVLRSQSGRTTKGKHEQYFCYTIWA